MLKSRWKLGRVWLHGSLVCAVCWSSALAVGTASAQQRSLRSSLDLVPADTAFYWSSMNHAAIWDAVIGSEAYRQTQKTPLAVKLRNGYRRGRSRGWEIFGENPLRYYLEGWANSIDSPGGQIAMPYIKQILGSEVFIYGDHRWLEWRAAINAVYSELAPLMAEMQEGGEIDERLIWPVVQRQFGQLAAPTVVVGAFVEEPEAFQGLLDLAANGLAQGLAQVPPEFQFLADGFSVERGEGKLVLTWNIRGDDIPWEVLRDTPDLRNSVPTIQQLCRGKTVGFAFGIQGNLLFVSLGENNDHQRKFGAGPLLVDLPPLQPVKQALADGAKLTGVSYLSAQTVAANRDFRGTFGLVPLMVKQMLRDSEFSQVSPATQQELVAELRTAVQDLEIELSQGADRAGAYLSYSFLQPEGIEGFVLDYSQPEFTPSAEPLAVLSHVGPAPALAVLERSRGLQQQYDAWRPWIERGFRIVEEFGPEFAPNSTDAQFAQEMLARVELLGARLDKVLRNSLVPQIDGRSLAVVVELNQKKTSWFRDMPELAREVPLPGVAIAIEFEDRQAIEALGTELLAFADSVVAMVREVHPELPPEFKLPQATVESSGDSAMYAYPLPPEAGVSEAIAPHARVADRFLFLGYLPEQTAELSAKNSAQFFGPAAEPDGAHGLAFLDVPQWVDAAAAWLEYGFAAADAQGQSVEIAGGGQDPLLDMSHDEIEQTLGAWLQFFKCCRGYSARSDIVDGVQRTHFLWRFEDLPASSEK